MTANVNTYAVVVCGKDKVNPVSFSWKWGEDEFPIVDQYADLGVQISKDCSLGSTHSKSIRKDVGEMDAILTGWRLHTI